MPKRMTNADLREQLFETLRAVRDEKNPLDLGKAQAVVSISGQIIASARLDIDAAKVSGTMAVSGFLEIDEDAAQESEHKLVNVVKTSTGTKIVAQIDGGSFTTHRMR